LEDSHWNSISACGFGCWHGFDEFFDLSGVTWRKRLSIVWKVAERTFMRIRNSFELLYQHVCLLIWRVSRHSILVDQNWNVRPVFSSGHFSDRVPEFEWSSVIREESFEVLGLPLLDGLPRLRASALPLCIGFRCLSLLPVLVGFFFLLLDLQDTSVAPLRWSVKAA